MRKDNEMIKLIDLQLQHIDNNSMKMLEFYREDINFYNMLIDNLKANKPYFWQKKKLNEYNRQLDKYNSKINEIYKSIEKL